MCIKIQVCIFKDESILNLIYHTLLKETSITCNESLIQKFLTVYHFVENFMLNLFLSCKNLYLLPFFKIKTKHWISKKKKFNYYFHLNSLNVTKFSILLHQNWKSESLNYL